MRTHIITLELRCGESVHLHILRCFKGLSFQDLLFFPKSQLAPSGHAGVIIRASSATLSRDHPIKSTLPRIITQGCCALDTEAGIML